MPNSRLDVAPPPNSCHATFHGLRRSTTVGLPNGPGPVCGEQSATGAPFANVGGTLNDVLPTLRPHPQPQHEGAPSADPRCADYAAGEVPPPPAGGTFAGANGVVPMA